MPFSEAKIVKRHFTKQEIIIHEKVIELITSLCIDYNHLELVYQTIKNNDSVAHLDVYYDILLQLASEKGHRELVKLLYWKYTDLKRISMQTKIPSDLLNGIVNCELMYQKFPYEIVEIIKRCV